MGELHRFIQVVLLALMTLGVAGCGGEPTFSPLPPGSSVLALGDSVTRGTGAAEGEDYPSRLAEISGWTVHNHGVPGDTTAGAKARIADALEETQPRLVIVEIGGNDFLRRRPETEIRENISSILKTIKRAGIPVVLVSTPRFSLLGAATGSLPDAELYADLAEAEVVPLIPDVFADVLSDPSLKSDQVHPNAAGYRQLAEGIAAELMETGLLAPR